MIKRWLPLLLIGSLLLFGCGDDAPEGNNGEPPTTTNNYSIEDGSLVDASTVSVGRVETTDPSWIVVFEQTNLLGHIRVEAGESTDVDVPLDVALSSGSHTLEAILYRDEGALEQFEVPGNDRPILENGALVSTVFDGTIDDEFSPSLTVSDQTLSSAEASAVTVDMATARDDAWIVVRSGACTDAAADAGDIRGTRAVARGENADVAVDVAPEVSDGETLCAYLHEDDPKDGNFNYQDGGSEDLPVNIEGSLVRGQFVVSVGGAAGDPVVEASDQTVSGNAPNEVVVDRVVSQDAGWIVIHRGSCSNFGEVVGHAAVDDGENTDVTVTFDTDEWSLGTAPQFCAMLHADNPDDDTFTFDGTNGEDFPVLDEGGNNVVADFTVTVEQPQQPGLSVSDQLLETSTVVVDSVYVPDGVWLAVYEDDGAGNRGEMVGSTQISPTPLTDVSVDIDPTALSDSSLDDGETLHVAVHTDNPNDETFDPTGGNDPVSLDDQGDEYATSFVVGVPFVDATDQTVDLSTVVTVDAVKTASVGWLAAYDGACPDSGSSWGALLGLAPTLQGDATDVDLGLDMPLTDQQTICVVLHNDDPSDDTFENTDPASSPDAADTGPSGDVLQTDITVTVPAGTPAMRYAWTHNGTTAWTLTSVEPAHLAPMNLPMDNPALTLQTGWRYEFVNSANANHPFEFVTAGAAPNQDTILFSQFVDPNPETSRTDVAWTEVDASTVRFTADAAEFADVDAYRCQSHRADMRGTVTLQ